MTNHRFQTAHRIKFSECDPAGIVFYPQYFVLFNDLFESWIDSLIPDGFAGLISRRRCGTPTVHLETEFKAISRMGDDVKLSLELSRLGTRSMTLALACTDRNDMPRMSAKQTIVTISLETYAAIPIPDDLRAALERAAPSSSH